MITSDKQGVHPALRLASEETTDVGNIMVAIPGYAVGATYEVTRTYDLWGKPTRLAVVADIASDLGMGTRDLRASRMRAQYRTIAAWRRAYPSRVLNVIEDIQSFPNPIGWGVFGGNCSNLISRVPLLLGWSGDYLVAAVAPVASRNEALQLRSNWTRS